MSDEEKERIEHSDKLCRKVKTPIPIYRRVEYNQDKEEENEGKGVDKTIAYFNHVRGRQSW